MSSQKKYIQPKMVNWYQPSILASTALRTVISGTFANYADKRELEAALDPKNTFYDHSVKENSDKTETALNEIWIDYISDTGDGFNPTYTVASLVAKDLSLKLQPSYELTPDRKTAEKQTRVEALKKEGTEKLKSGNLLILGGDQVYPTPGMDDYTNRFKIPFSAAHNIPNDQRPPENERPVMYAIPGNHDWYDGLTNFMKLFAQVRWFGNWITKQKRSYFAIKLPHNYWLWGIDIQLNADIDEQQKLYFERIAKENMPPDSKVILCTAEPSWVYKQVKCNDETYKRLKYFEEIYITADSYNKIGKKFKIAATLTGDLHHYSRYSEERLMEEGGNKTECNHLFTAGGGGAFMHTTHMLPKSLDKLSEDYDFMKSTLKSYPNLEMTFPSRKLSKKLIFLNLLFPYFNKFFCMLMGFLALLFLWNIVVFDHITDSTFVQPFFSGFCSYTLNLFKGTIYHPVFLFMSGLVLAGFTLFTDTERTKWFYLWGFIHGKLHLAAIFFSVYIAQDFFYCTSFEIDKTCKIFIAITYCFFSGAFLNGLFMGIYLFISGYFFNIHITEASSSFSYQHYKNFLRIHINSDGDLTIYPIGIKKVVRKWKQDETQKDITFTSDDAPEVFLIEPPITIKNN
ncbi:metallophosphoesterase [Flavobacterium hydrophilum]|uniref:Metallophosphoesterase n=1 Tax=Flavobacterium hydrophilum TaxID=2211445 RepID=A0A2V4C651_9FLAO|nr:metallophosphoesterase [Flavobacterium hydrophilum]PXY46467.1 metallophosphoesterase [Flavobacterium hydrophilum]